MKTENLEQAVKLSKAIERANENLKKVRHYLELINTFDYNGNYYGLIQHPFSDDWPKNERDDMPVSISKNQFAESLQIQITSWEGRVQELNDKYKALDQL